MIMFCIGCLVSYPMAVAAAWLIYKTYVYMYVCMYIFMYKHKNYNCIHRNLSSASCQSTAQKYWFSP